MSACIGEPISWLRLERRRLGELAPEEQARVDEHLALCEACRSAADVRPWTLPPLPAPARRRAVWALAVPAALAAGFLLWSARPSSTVKGAAVAMALVREHAGEIDLEPTVFSPADRFKVLVTCPPPHVVSWQVAVFQDGAVTFPLAGERLPCANRVPLPGAFTLGGATPATVCLLWGRIDRPRLSREGAGAAGPSARCERLVPRP